MSSRVPLVAALVVLGALAGAVRGRPAAAHPLAPALLELREAPDGRVEATWRVSRRGPAGVRVEPALPQGCRPVAPPAHLLDGPALETRWTLDCGPGRLAGRRVGVRGLAAARTDAIVRWVRPDGSTTQHVLRGSPGAANGARASDSSDWTLPRRPRPSSVVGDYVALGAGHIAAGLDHLLFVFGLVLLVGTAQPRRLLATITAFTAGHSVTLALAALGVVRVPVGPVELAIAGSLFVLALELGRPGAAGAPGDEPARASALQRRPWLMAGSFGLLHGLGFAAALASAGLPDGEIPLALASFNVGIELGQLAFVAALLAAGAALRPWLSRLPPRAALVAHRAPVYVLGGLAAFWCLERAAPWV